MLPKLQEAKHRYVHRIWLEFADGVKGEVDLESELWGVVVEPLKDKSCFAVFSLNNEPGTIVWPTGADFAPEFLYQKLHPDYALRAAPKSGAA